jgi:hypothetical protein
MGMAKRIDNVPERISTWLSWGKLQIALNEGWFLQFNNIIIKTYKQKNNGNDRGKNLWAFYTLKVYSPHANKVIDRIT